MSSAMKANLLLLAAGLCALPLAAEAEPAADYVAHEWGTFTSVQGADGVQIAWNPINVSELPKFVYDRTRSAGGAPFVLAKSAFMARQRLETPVIYFHSPQHLDVSVTVRFPQGTVTEWFPTASIPKVQRAGNPALEWKSVSIIPRNGLAASKASGQLPREPRGSHYYAAREAEADFVRVRSGDGEEFEKFLFYRGIGNFDAPLRVAQPSSDPGVVKLENPGDAPLRNLFLVSVRDEKMAITAVPALEARTDLTISAADHQPIEIQRGLLAGLLRQALVEEGLYASEAAAMVKTWEDSWFDEPGLRVLYVLPTAFTEKVLPLSLEPAPKEIARVMVGRAEVLTVQMEQALAAEFERYKEDKPGDRTAAVANVRALGLGRFLDATLRRLIAQRPEDKALSTLGWELLQAASKPKAAVELSRR
jgi:hypothetical protein